MYRDIILQHGDTVYLDYLARLGSSCAGSIDIWNRASASKMFIKDFGYDLWIISASKEERVCYSKKEENKAL
jgi:hypothetical protein